MDNLMNSPIDEELSKLSPFELKGRIIEMANDKVKKGDCRNGRYMGKNSYAR